MVDARAAILKGRREAGRLHRRFGMREHVETVGGSIDVFETIVKLGVPLLFKPLDGLLGVFISQPIPGMMITTKRGLGVQRFTGSHELGHCRLGHRPSLDDESILRRSPFIGTPDYDQQEIEADAFATEFMLPPWLFAAHFAQQGWTPAHMADPATVYQLSLRIGASYEATCRSLIRPGVNVIGRQTLNGLLKMKPKDIKKTLLGQYEPPDWRRDVWLLTAKDEGTRIEGGRADLFILRLMEHSGSGYVWTFDELNDSGFAIVRDDREGPSGDTIGGHTMRSITARSERQQTGQIALAERRPWLTDAPPLKTFSMQYDLNGPEDEGLSQIERRLLLEAA